MNLYERSYKLGDVVLFLAYRRNEQSELQDEPPTEGRGEYVVAEGMVTALTQSYGEPNATEVVSISIVGRNGRQRYVQYYLNASTVISVLNRLRARVTDNPQKYEFMKNLAAPLVVSSSSYNRLLRDLRQAAGTSGEVSTADADDIAARAAELGLPVLRLDTAHSACTSRWRSEEADALRRSLVIIDERDRQRAGNEETEASETVEPPRPIPRTFFQAPEAAWDADQEGETFSINIDREE